MTDAPFPAHWPTVPACYGWLALDRRGQWRLQGEPVRHPGLIQFLNRHYAHDEAGRWFVQNGPQRVYVDLLLTPWIYRSEGAGFVSHTGQPAGEIRALYLDAEGSILIDAELGVGVLDDRDIPAVLAACTDATGEPAGEEALLAIMAGRPHAVRHEGRPLLPLPAVDLARHFGFVRQPRAAEAS